MKRLLIFCLSLLSLLAGIILFIYFMNTGIDAPPVDQVEVDYPIGFLLSEDILYNPMVPHLNKMDFFTIDDSITVVQDQITVYINKKDIQNVEYEIVDLLTLDTLDSGNIQSEFIQSHKNGIRFTIPIGDWLEGKEYCLKFFTQYRNQKVGYYQRFKVGDNQITEILSRLTDLHNNMLEHDDKALEWIKGGEKQGTFYNASQNAPKEILLWKQESVASMHSPYPIIKQYNERTGTYEVKMNFVVAKRSEHEFEYWDFVESYNGTVTRENIQIQEYSRKGSRKNEPYFERDTLQWVLDEGIQNPSAQMLSENEEFMAISHENELWLLDKEYNELTKVFGYDALDSDYILDEWNEHKIKLLDVDDKGNVTFIVYGYFSGGKYVGYNGLQVIQYSQLHKVNEILVFIPLSYPVDYLDYFLNRSVYQKAYNRFLFFIDQMLYSVDLHDKKVSKALDLPRNLYFSEEEIWYSLQKQKENYQVDLIRLNTEKIKKQTITLDDNIRVIGNIGQKIIIGEYKLEDTLEKLDGSVLYPYRRLVVIGESGQISQEIQAKEDHFIGNVRIDGQTVVADILRLEVIKGYNALGTKVNYQATDTLQEIIVGEEFDDKNEEKKLLIYYDDIGKTIIDNKGASLRETFTTAITNDKKTILGSELSPLYQSYYEVYQDKKLIGFYLSLDNAFAIIGNLDSIQVYKRKDTGERKLIFDNTNSPTRQILNVPILSQFPELPRGCEVTSLAMLLNNFLEEPVHKVTLSKEITYDDTERKLEDGLIHYGDLHKGFVGSMTEASKDGLGVYIDPIIDVAMNYMNEENVINVSKIHMSQLLTYLDQGYPVQVIVPIHYNQVFGYMIQNWKTPSGYMEITYKEHSVVITGYDDAYIYFNDPDKGKVMKQEIGKFQTGWEDMGSQALVILGE